MNLINKISIIIFIGGSALLLFSWNIRSFQLLLIALVLFTLGVVSIYIARIFEEVRGRDSYIIKDIKKN